MSAFSALFSYTAVFLAVGIYCAILLRDRRQILGSLYPKPPLRQHPSPNSPHSNNSRRLALCLLASLALLGGFFLSYYFLYIRYQRVEGFYEYWQSFFLPHSLRAYPSFLPTLLGIFEGFSPFLKPHIMPLYFLLGGLGLVVAYRRNRSVFLLSACCLLVYVGLSLGRIYPFGHEGVIGGRLSLYMSPIFHLLAAYALWLLYERWKLLTVLLVGGILLATLLRLGRIYPHWHYIQQTHELIRVIESRATSSDLIAIYESSKPAFMYYSFLDGRGLIDPSKQEGYTTFTQDLSALARELKQSKSPRIFLLISHYRQQWFAELQALAREIDSQAEFLQGVGGWGSWLIIIHKGREHKGREGFSP